MKRSVFLVVLLAAGALTLPSRSAGQGASDTKKPGASLHGYRFEFPCKNAMPANPKPGEDCESGLVKGDPKKTDNFTAERRFGGDKGKRYKVTLRFRGVVEPMMY